MWNAAALSAALTQYLLTGAAPIEARPPAAELQAEPRHVERPERASEQAKNRGIDGDRREAVAVELERAASNAYRLRVLVDSLDEQHRPERLRAVLDAWRADAARDEPRMVATLAALDDRLL